MEIRVRNSGYPVFSFLIFLGKKLYIWATFIIWSGRGFEGGPGRWARQCASCAAATPGCTPSDLATWNNRLYSKWSRHLKQKQVVLQVISPPEKTGCRLLQVILPPEKTGCTPSDLATWKNRLYSKWSRHLKNNTSRFYFPATYWRKQASIIAVVL